MAFQKKTSASSEVVLGSAAVSLKKFLAEINVANTAATVAINNLTEQSEALQLKIASQEDALEALETQFQEKTRAASVEFQVKLKADKLTTAIQVLSDEGKVAVASDVWKAMGENLEMYKTKFEEKVKADVEGATRGIASAYTQKEKIMEAEFKAKEAGNLAAIENLRGQVEFLNSQVALWKKALDDERNASVERAKHGAANVNVGTGFTGK